VGSSPADPARALQHALYRAAKADPGRRFHTLRDTGTREEIDGDYIAECGHSFGPCFSPRTDVSPVTPYPLTKCLDVWTVVYAGSTIQLPNKANTFVQLSKNLSSGHVVVCP
jgi:hypothetical protein